MKRIDHIAGQAVTRATAGIPLDHDTVPNTGGAPHTRNAASTIDYERIVAEVLRALDARELPLAGDMAPLPAHEVHRLAGPRPAGPHPHPRPDGPCQVIPLPPHHAQRVSLDADALHDSLAVRGLSAASRALASAPAEVKVAASLLADVPVTFSDAPAPAPHAASCGFDNPLLSGEPLQRLAEALEADAGRVAAELAGAPAEMTAIVMLALQAREQMRDTTRTPDAEPAATREEV